MKDAKKYAKKVRQLFRSLKQKSSKPKKCDYEDPVEAIVYAIISEAMPEQRATGIIKKFNDYFIDINDLRVSRPEEIIEVIGEDSCLTRQMATNLTTALNAVFERHNMVSLADLKKLGKKPAKEALSKIPGTSPFVVDYCMLTAFGGHAFPLTARMLEFLKVKECIYGAADGQEIVSFLSRQIPAKDAYEFHSLVRQESEKLQQRREKKPRSAGAVDDKDKKNKRPAKG
jgi:endonuclease III